MIRNPADSDGEVSNCTAADVSATLYFRGVDQDDWRQTGVDIHPSDLHESLDLWDLSFTVPVPGTPRLDYYVEVKEQSTETTVTFPYEGAAGPLQLWIRDASDVHELQPIAFGSHQAPTSAIRMTWGSQSGQVGLDLGNEAQTVGPQAIDVDAGGEIYLLDQLNDRVQVLDPGGSVKSIYSIDIGPLGDIALGRGEDGQDDTQDDTFTILDTLPNGPGSVPTISLYGERSISASPSVNTNDISFASPIKSVPSPESEPVSLTVDEGLIWVYGTPSDGWRPVMSDEDTSIQTSSPPDLSDVHFQMGMPCCSGKELLQRVRNSKRVDIAIAEDPNFRISLEAPSDRYFGELALAERLPGGDFLVVVRTWQEQPIEADQHEVIRLSPTGEILNHFAVANSEFAMTGSLSEFRLGEDGNLYQLWSDETGFEIRRFSL